MEARALSQAESIKAGGGGGGQRGKRVDTRQRITSLFHIHLSLRTALFTSPRIFLRSVEARWNSVTSNSKSPLGFSEATFEFSARVLQSSVFCTLCHSPSRRASQAENQVKSEATDKRRATASCSSSLWASVTFQVGSRC